MAHAVDHNLILGRVVKDHVRMGRDDHTTQAIFARKLTGMGMTQQEIHDHLNAPLHM